MVASFRQVIGGLCMISLPLCIGMPLARPCDVPDSVESPRAWLS